MAVGSNIFQFGDCRWRHFEPSSHHFHITDDNDKDNGKHVELDDDKASDGVTLIFTTYTSSVLTIYEFSTLNSEYLTPSK